MGKDESNRKPSKKNQSQTRALLSKLRKLASSDEIGLVDSVHELVRTRTGKKLKLHVAGYKTRMYITAFDNLERPRILVHYDIDLKSGKAYKYIDRSLERDLIAQEVSRIIDRLIGKEVKSFHPDSIPVVDRVRKSNRRMLVLKDFLKRAKIKGEGRESEIIREMIKSGFNHRILASAFRLHGLNRNVKRVYREARRIR